MPLDRRRFLQLSAGAAAAAHLPAQPLAPVAGGAPPSRLRSPGYDQVVLAASIAQTQQSNALAVLNTFDDDALLKPFRAMGGQPAPGRDLGGWYTYVPTYDYRSGDAGFAPGHSFGQWTSAMARFAVAQNDEQARHRVLRLHQLLADSITPEFFDQTRFPAYTLDKLNCGLADAYTLLGDPNALALADKVRQCALPSLPAGAQDRDAQLSWRKDRDLSWHWDESYTLPENLYLLANAGAGSPFRAMAQQYTLDSFFAPLAQGHNVLGGLHGYSHINALCSAVQAYLTEGNTLYRDAAVNGYRMIAAQSYATGGWAPDELFEKPGSGKLLASLGSTHNSFETPCGTYAFFKLSRYLLQLTREAHYGDAMERLLFNSMFGALPLQPDGRTFYYADLNQNARRIYSVHRWPCCAGTYTQLAADYGVHTYLLDPDLGAGVWVNLYLPSTLRWTQGPAQLSLTQTGSYPLSEHVQIAVQTSAPSRFPLRLRLPAWCSAPSLRLNGQPVALSRSASRLPGDGRAQGWATLDRVWRHGDHRLDLHLPATLRLEPLPSDGGPPQPKLAALCWGPLVLCPLAPTPTATPDQLLRAERTGDTEWRIPQSTGDLTFRPFSAVGNSPYATYLRLT